MRETAVIYDHLYSENTQKYLYSDCVDHNKLWKILKQMGNAFNFSPLRIMFAVGLS